MFLKPVFPVLDYAINYDYISKELCENKDKPNSCCEGKCYLKKELAKEANSDTSTDKSNSSNKKNFNQEQEILFYQESKTTVIENFHFIQKSTLDRNYSNHYSYLDSSSVFRPPIFIG